MYKIAQSITGSEKRKYRVDSQPVSSYGSVYALLSEKNGALHTVLIQAPEKRLTTLSEVGKSDEFVEGGDDDCRQGSDENEIRMNTNAG